MANKDFVVKNGLTVANTVTVNSTAIYYGATLVVNSTTFTGTANNATNLGGTAAAGYQTTAGLSANVLVLTSNNSGYLGGTIAASYALLAGPTFTGTVNVSTGSLYSNNLFVNGDGTNGTIKTINANSALSIGTNNNVQMTIAANGVVTVNNQVTVGANVIANTTAYFVGNSSVNAYITCAGLYVNGAAFTSGGGYYKGNKGAVGDASNSNNIFRINANTISSNITFLAGENASAAGPLTIGTGNTVTISTGARVVIV